MSRADNSHHLQRAAAARHDAAVTGARNAIEQLDRAGTPITFTAVADAAGVSRSWLYNQPDLRDTITGLRRTTGHIDGSDAGRATRHDRLPPRTTRRRPRRDHPPPRRQHHTSTTSSHDRSANNELVAERCVDDMSSTHTAGHTPFHQRAGDNGT